MIIEIIVLLLWPTCAIVAGFFVWLTNRNEEATDGTLLGTFVTVFCLALLTSFQILRSDTVRVKLDPEFRLKKELEAHRLHSTIQELAPDDIKKLDDFLKGQLAGGATLEQAFVQARPLLTRMLRHRIGFADQSTALAWARYLLDNLKEFQEKDPTLCYALIGGHALDSNTLATAFDAENTRRFEDLGVTIYQSADRGMRHERPSGDKPADFNATAREYSAIQEEIEREFGKEIATMIRKREFSIDTSLSHRQICKARIYQLEHMMQRPQAQAAMLVRSVLY